MGSLGDRLYTTQSDVWSFGVTMWEIFTRSQAPYPGIPNHEVYEHLLHGMRLKQPENCPDHLSDIMTSCWRTDRSLRPTFSQVVDQLKSFRDSQRTAANPVYINSRIFMQRGVAPEHKPSRPENPRAISETPRAIPENPRTIPENEPVRRNLST